MRTLIGRWVQFVSDEWYFPICIHSRYFDAVLRIGIRILIPMFLGHPDPLVWGPDPDPSIIKQIVRKTLIPTVLWLLYDCLSLKNDVNVAGKSNKQKNNFLLPSWRSLTKIAGSGAEINVQNLHGLLFYPLKTLQDLIIIVTQIYTLKILCSFFTCCWNVKISDMFCSADEEPGFWKRSERGGIRAMASALYFFQQGESVL